MNKLKEMAEEFEVSVPAMLGYVRRNLEEINSDGNHAYKHRGDWQFDEVAVERIKRLREASKAELWSNKVKLRKLTKEQELDLNEMKSVVSKLENKVKKLEKQVQELQETTISKSVVKKMLEEFLE